MKELLRKVEKELETIGDKGLTSSNLDTTFKLIDIYKDIKEACYYEEMTNKDGYGEKSRDTYRDRDWHEDRHRSYPLTDRDERYIKRIEEGMYNYNEGRDRYRDGQSKDRMIEGVEMAMGALVNFVEYMMDYAETPQEKEVVRKYIGKMKNL